MKIVPVERPSTRPPWCSELAALNHTYPPKGPPLGSSRVSELLLLIYCELICCAEDTIVLLCEVVYGHMFVYVVCSKMVLHLMSLLVAAFWF